MDDLTRNLCMFNPRTAIHRISVLFAAFLLLFTFSTVVSSNTDKDYEKLEQRLFILEDKLRHQDDMAELHDSDHEHLETNLDRVSISGFASFGLELLDAEDDWYLNSVNNQLRTTRSTVLGVQMRFAIQETTDFILQIQAYEREDNSVFAEWAYLNHSFNNNWSMRVGAMRLPFFMISEYSDVGYAYLWANTPSEVYDGTVNLTFTGLNVGYDADWGNAHHALQFYGGTHYSRDIDAFIDSIYLDDFLGTRYDVSWLSWRLGMSYTGGVINANMKEPAFQPYLPKDSKGEFIGIGLFYEGERLSWLNEWVHQKVDAFYPSEQAYYSTLAYRTNDWEPYITFAQLATSDNERRPADSTESYKQTSVSVGTRYDFFPNFAVKFEAQHILSEHNSDRIGRPDGAAADGGEDLTLYTLRLDMVF